MHHLVRRTWPARTLAYLFCAALLAQAGHTLAAAAMLAWPHVVLVCQYVGINSAAGARHALIADGLVAGMIAARLDLEPLIVIALAGALVLSARMVARAQVVALVVVAFVVSLAIASMVLAPGLPSLPDAGRLLAFAMILGYGLFVARLGYMETSRLSVARRDAERSREDQARTVRELQPFIPPLPGRPAISGQVERLPLTVCFADLVGFTAAMERGPEDQVTALLNRYLEGVTCIVEAHGGEVNKFMGDGVMILFGRGQVDRRRAAIACLEAALAIRRFVGRLATTTWPLRVRLGVHTGYCALGFVGSAARMEHTALGRVVNVAARIEAAAEPDELLVTKEVLGLLDHNFAFRRRGVRCLKGVPAPVPVFAVSHRLDSGYEPRRASAFGV